MSSFKSSVGDFSVEFPSEVPHIEEVVMDASFLDKGTLTWRDEFIDERRKA